MRLPVLLILAAHTLASAAVSTIHVPNGGIQPQIVEKDGIVHLLYFSGAPEKGNLFYVRSRDYGVTFSPPSASTPPPPSPSATSGARNSPSDATTASTSPGTAPPPPPTSPCSTPASTTPARPSNPSAT